MKIFVSVLFVSLLSSLSASAASNSLSWNAIFDSPIYKVHDASVIHPDGASLFNVCVYSDSQFRVIDPEPECVATQSVTVGGNPKDAFTIDKCVEFAPVVEPTLVSSFIETCAVESVETTPGPVKDAVSTYICVEQGEPAEVPTKQTVDVYRDTNNYVFAFQKVYEVPNCMAVTPVPPKK